MRAKRNPALSCSADEVAGPRAVLTGPQDSWEELILWHLTRPAEALCLGSVKSRDRF
jgi:hypothetical protein